MSEKQKYLNFKADRETLASRIIGIRNESSRLKESIEPTEDEALRLEVLGSPGAREKKALLKENRERIGRLEAELDEANKKLKIMDSLMNGFREKAFAEVSVEQKRVFEKELRVFVKKVREVIELEKSLVEVRKKIKIEFDNIDKLTPIQEWPPIFLRQYPGSPTELEETLKKWESQFDLD
jgi:hypothetical protein